MIERAGTPLLLAVVIGLGIWGDAAQAGQAFMHTGGRTTQPVGHYEFCQREAVECRQKTSRQAPVELTRRLVKKFRQVEFQERRPPNSPSSVSGRWMTANSMASPSSK